VKISNRITLSNHLLGVDVSSEGQHRLMHLTHAPFLAAPDLLFKPNKLKLLFLSLVLLCTLFLRLPLPLLLALRLLDDEVRFPPLLFPEAFDVDLMLNFCALDL